MALSRKAKIIIGIGLLAVLSVAVVIGVYASRSDAPEVTVVPTKKQAELRSTVTAPGEIRPIQFINLTSEVQGRIEEIYVKEGDSVEKGQQLVRLDPNQLQSNTDAQLAAFEASREDVQASRTQVIAAQNQLSQAQQGLNASEAAVNTANEAVNQAKQGALTAEIELRAAERELKRVEELVEAGAESRQNYDQAKDRVATARANLASRSIAVTEAGARVKEAKARADQQAVAVKDARRAVQTANFSASASESRANQQAANLRGQRNLRDKTLQVAPISGVIADIPSKVGTFATANLSSTPLLTIADMSTINVEVKVDETEIDKVAVGQPAKVKVDAFGEQEIIGEVTQKTPLAVGKSQTSGGLSSNINISEAKEFKVVIELKDVKDEIKKGLRPGMSATAVITTEVKKDVIAVPIQSVVEKKKDDKGGGEDAADEDEKPKPQNGKKEETVKGVFVLEGNKVKFLEVTTGITGESDIEVTSGLKEGQEVITGPSRILNTLKEGDTVKKQQKKEGEGNKS
jgi:HlyD family secretion protein